MRHIITTVIEAVTPFSIGTSKYSEISDAPVLTDANELPYIPGTTLAGIINSIVDLSLEDIEAKGANQKLGSAALFSQGYLLDEKGKPVRGLQEIASESFLEKFIEKNLPVRENVSINHRGVTNKSGKFDKQVVYRGTRFIFEIEILQELSGRTDEILDALKDCRFRIGGKTRSGFGNFKVVSLEEESFDLDKKEDLKAYAKRERYKSQSKKSFEKKLDSITISSENSSFLFSQGYGDQDADIVPASEIVVCWETGKPEFKKQYFLPASSIKGALRHRTAFYYNQATGEEKEADKCEGVKNLFGEKVDGDNGSAGKLFIDDAFFDITNETSLNHVSLDRFTQKPINGALFNEKVVFSDKDIKLNYFLEKGVDKESEKAFNKAIEDLKDGYLPLGGGVNRGHGRFKEVKNA